jgi:hypothetical protein
MPDDFNAAPGGGEGASAPISVITPAADTGENLSVSQAARALAAARHRPKDEFAPSKINDAGRALLAGDEAPQPELSDEDNAAPVEEPALSEDATEAEPAEVPPIEPPRSWTKEAKERWQSLPRETQEYLAEREQERDREVRRSQNETADKLKGLTAQQQAAEQVRQEYEAKLTTVMQGLTDANNGAFPDIRNVDDVAKMAAEDPFRYIQWKAHQDKMVAVNFELSKAQERQTQEHSTKWTDHVRKENELFAERVPEFADPAKAKELTNKAVTQLHDLGFSDAELADLATGKEKLSIFDHRVQLLIHGNLKLSDIQKAKSAAVAKPVPPVQRPGVARPQGAGQSEALQALATKFERTGSLKDAAALRIAQTKAQARRA